MASNEQIIGLIKAGSSRQQSQAVYGTNREGRRAAFILPDGTRPSAFVPDPDGANVDGADVARLIYQVRLPSDPPGGALGNNSRVGMWMSTVWDANALTPTRKASHYSLYVLAKGFCQHRDFPQEVSAVVAKAETAAGVEHGKTETSIFVAEHELGYSPEEAAGFALLTEAGEGIVSEAGAAVLNEAAAALPANGKLVVQQQVLVFRGPDIGWDAEPPEEIPADPDEEGSVPDPQDRYFGFGTAFNNAGPTPGFAAGIVKARKPEQGGSPWHHGFFVKQSAVGAYPFRFQKHWGVQAPGFDPGDGSGARTMSYMGLGTDLPDTPLHLKGPVTLEQRFEYEGDASAAYTLGRLSFHGRSSLAGASLVASDTEMAAVDVQVADPTRHSESAEVRVRTVQGGQGADRLRIGGGLYTPAATGGDKGPETLNLKALYVDGVLELGVDPATAPPVTAIGVTQTKQGMVVKATAPADARLRAVNVYRNPGSDNAAAAQAAGAVDTYACRSGRRIKWVDTDALTSGTDYYYYFATVTRKEAEGAPTLIGHAVYRGLQSADVEPCQIRLGTHVADSAGALVGDNDALNTKVHDPRGYNRNPTFQRWTASLPDNWTAGGSASAAKATASPRYGAWAMDLAVPAAADQWLQTYASTAGELRVPASADDYYVVEYEVTLVAGDFKRAGVWVNAPYQDAANYKGFRLHLFDEHPSPTVGATYSGAKVLANESGAGAPAGLPSDLRLFAIGNWSSLSGGAFTAKTLRWHRLLVRKATREEVRAAKGFDDNGDLARDLTPARKVSSQVMSHATGGTFTGDLTATFGAALGSSLKDSGGTTVTDNDALNAKAHAAAGYNRNPTFQRWSGAAGSPPDNFTRNGGAGGTVSKQASGALYGAWAMRTANLSGQPGSVSATQASGELRPSKDLDYVTFEWEVGLVAGDFVRAGIIYRLYYGGGTATYKQFIVDFNAEHPSTTAGLYGDVKTVGVSSTVGAPSGAPTGAELFLANADAALSGALHSAKTLDWHRVTARKPSREEIRTVTLGALASKSTVAAADIDPGAATPTAIGPRRLNGLVLDPSFTDANYWSCTNGGQIVTGTNGTIAMGVASAFQASSALATGFLLQAVANRGANIPCEPNVTYQVKAISRVTQGFNGQVQLGLSYYQYDGSSSAIKATEVIGGTDHTSSPAASAANEDLNLTFTTPADCDQIRVVARVSWGANYPGSHAGIGLIGRLRISASAAYNDSALLAAANVYSGTNDFAQPPRPTGDNSVTLGSATRRWSQLYAGTATINTSDAREKTEVGEVPQAVIDVVAALPAQAFRFTEAVERKGEGARWHYGFIAQEVGEAMAAAGHDPHAHGFFCEDPVCEAVEAIGEDGRPCMVETPVADAEGRPVTRLGLRLDHLFAIRLEADARRLAALEARVAALGG